MKDDVTTRNGLATFELKPPSDAVALSLTAVANGKQVDRIIQSSYSPSGNFIHVTQVSNDVAQVGDTVSFRVHSTSEARNFYYEVVARDRIVFSGHTRDDEFSFDTTPLMAPSSKLLVYQVLPNSEVAADYVPFKVVGMYPHEVDVSFSTDEAEPGDEVRSDVRTDGRAMVGLAAVDKSVFILAENRLNLQQVFAELERLYMEPQAELHDVSIYPTNEGIAIFSIDRSEEYGRQRLIEVAGGHGTDLLGLAVGQQIDWIAPNGQTVCARIVAIPYQPERAGDYML